MFGWGVKQLPTEFSVKMNHCFVNVRSVNCTPVRNVSRGKAVGILRDSRTNTRIPCVFLLKYSVVNWLLALAPITPSPGARVLELQSPRYFPWYFPSTAGQRFYFIFAAGLFASVWQRLAFG